MEVGVTAAPVGDLGERVCDEDVLQTEALRCYTANTHYMLTPDWLVWRIITPPPADLGSGINQADSMFVDCYQEAFWVIWISGLLKKKNCGY